MAVTNPIQVSSDPEFRQSRSEFNPMYFEIGSNLYQVLVAAQDTQRKLGVFKRATSDVGGAWVRQDDADSPDAGNQLGYLYPVLNSDTGVIRVFYILTSDSLFHYCDFDTNTDTWGTPSPGTDYSGASGTFNRSFVAYRKSNGDYVGLFNTSTHLYYFTVIAGVWSAITSILTATATLTGNGVVDGSDGFGFFTQESGTIVSYRYLDAAFSLSGATALTGSRSSKRTSAVAFGSGIAVGYTLTSQDVVVRISASFTAPSFTDYTIYVKAFTDETTSYASLAVGLASDLNIFFVVGNVNVIPIVDEFRQSTFDGVSTWSTPTLFYDETANPPADTVPDPVDQFLHTGDFIELPQGWTGATTMETVDGGDVQWCTGFFLESGSTCGDPIQVSPDAQFRPSASEINPYYFQVGSNLYQVLAASQGEAKIGVFKRAKSSISGAWAEQDAASSPSNTHQSGYLNVVKNGTKLAILYLLDDFVSLKIVEFDTATDTYGSPTSALTIPTSNGTFAFVLKGSMYVIIGSGPATLSANTYVVTNTGGTWSSITNIIAAPAITLYGALLDVFGMLRFFGNRVSQHLDMWTLDNSLALVSFIPHTFTNNLDFSKGRPSMVQISSTSYAVGFFTTLALHPFTAIVVTNTNTSPIYTPNSVYVQPSIGDPEEGSYATLALGLGGNLTAFFVRRNITSIPVIDEVDRSTISAGTWSAYATYYDAVANPPAGGASDTSQIIRALQPIQFGSGWSLALTMNTVSGEDTLQTGFYIDACGAGQTLQLTKTVIGGSAVPAMWLLTGTGPTPISGAGDTGALPVDPGTYALSESTGPDGYTPGAWDCGEAEMPTATSVVVPEGEDVVCNIDNTAGTPPFRASCPSPIYVVGTPYSSFVTVVGGVPPYTFTLLSGSLPTGLSLNATTGELSGTPSADGPFTFVIRVTDDNGDHADTSSCSAGRCPGTRSII